MGARIIYEVEIMGIGDQFNKFVGKTRYVVSRIFLQLHGTEVTPVLGVLNQAGRQMMEADGDLTITGECLVEVCQSLLQYENAWRAAGNEGEMMWDEGEAGGYVNELFTDSAQRYLSDPDPGQTKQDEDLTLPPTPNLVVMITVAFTGEDDTIEANLAEINAMKVALKSLINLHYQNRLEAIQVHFSPAQLGDQLSDDQILQNFPELLPL
jgi:Protein of unknown function (DUF1517)